MAPKSCLVLMITTVFGLLGGCLGESDEPRLIDLTWSLTPDIPVYPFYPNFGFTIMTRGQQPDGYWFEANEIYMNEHTGTHLDAPAHFARGAWRLDQIPLGHLTGPGAVLDVREKVGNNSDYAITLQDLQEWEQEHGLLPDNGILMLRTGWGERFWGQGSVPYLGTDQRNVSLLHSPGLHPDAAQWLVDNRRLNAIGTDTISVDTGDSTTYMAHRILLPNNVLVIENVGHLDELPPTGSTVYAMPIKIGDGSGAPSRVFAIIDGRTSAAGVTTPSLAVTVSSVIAIILQTFM